MDLYEQTLQTNGKLFSNFEFVFEFMAENRKFSIAFNFSKDLKKMEIFFKFRIFGTKKKKKEIQKNSES